MKLSICCPACTRPIAKPRSADEPIICPVCHSEYGVVSGKLSQRSSNHETLLYLTAKLPRFYKRHYTLQITTPDRTLKQLQFSIPGKADRVPVYSGDQVSVIYTMRGYVMQQLVAITNHTTGKSYVPSVPIASPGYLGAWLSTGTIALFVGSCLGGISWIWVGFLSALGLLIYFKLTHLAHLSTPPLATAGRVGQRLLSDRRLWTQQCQIEQRIQDLEHDNQAHRRLIEQLESLKQKMQRLDAALYSIRIFRATSAVKLIDQQIVNNRRLIREYQYALKMIDIEMETSWVAEQLPAGDEFSRKILHKLAELRAIEAQNDSLKLQLLAYQELDEHR